MGNKIMEFIDSEEQRNLAAILEPKGNMLATRHLFEQADIDAINAAIACRRPLLLTGEPGTGKSQLARAAASRLECAFVSFSVDSRTESRDLLWSFDAVGRLADAQLGKALCEDSTKLRGELAIHNYVHPGPLWWGFDWARAKEQAEKAQKRLGGTSDKEAIADIEPEQWDKGDPKNGCVILIDEIDKAEPSVPNGLLEALGNGCFLPDGYKQRIMVEGIAPLIIITSNEERVLPEAFLRRCLVHHLSLPNEPEALIETLIARGQAHFEDLSETLLKKAAKMVVRDRQKAQDNHYHPLPGQAAYIDLLRGVYQQADNAAKREALLEKVRPYAVAKGFQPAL